MTTSKRKPATKTTPVKKKEPGQSQFNFWLGKVTFTTEPLWYRLTIITMILAVAIYLGSALKNTAVPIFSKKTPPKTSIIHTTTKGRAP